MRKGPGTAWIVVVVLLPWVLGLVLRAWAQTVPMQQTYAPYGARVVIHSHRDNSNGGQIDIHNLAGFPSTQSADSIAYLGRDQTFHGANSFTGNTTLGNVAVNGTTTLHGAVSVDQGSGPTLTSVSVSSNTVRLENVGATPGATNVLDIPDITGDPTVAILGNVNGWTNNNDYQGPVTFSAGDHTVVGDSWTFNVAPGFSAGANFNTGAVAVASGLFTFNGYATFSGDESNPDALLAIRDISGAYHMNVFTEALTGNRDVTIRDRANQYVAASCGTPVDLSGQTSAIGTTNLYATPTAGMYMLVAYLEVTTAGSSGNITLTLGWTDRTGAKNSSLTLTITTTGSTRTQVPIRPDGASNVTYATSFSGTPGAVQYAVTIRTVAM